MLYRAMEKNFEDSKFDRTKSKSFNEITMDTIRLASGDDGFFEISTSGQAACYGFKLDSLEPLVVKGLLLVDYTNNHTMTIIRTDKAVYEHNLAVGMPEHLC